MVTTATWSSPVVLLIPTRCRLLPTKQLLGTVAPMALDLALNGAVALVTGGARGVGRGIAQVLRRAGAEVVVCGRTPPDDTTGFLTCDVRDPEQVGTVMT